jgi:hypothetical protein
MSSPGLAELTTYLNNAGWTLEDQDERTAQWRPNTLAEPDVKVVLPVRDTVLDMPDRTQTDLPDRRRRGDDR